MSVFTKFVHHLNCKVDLNHWTDIYVLLFNVFISDIISQIMFLVFLFFPIFFQAEASYTLCLSGFRPYSWWFSSFWTFECSAILVFTYINGESCGCWRFTPIRIWGSFHNICIPPCCPGCHIPAFFPLWDIFAEMDVDMKRFGNGQRRSVFIHKKPLRSLLEMLKMCQLQMPYINDCSYLSRWLVLKWFMTESVNCKVCK